MRNGDKEILDLVSLLNSEDTSEAQEAQDELELYGPAILDQLLEATPRLGAYGQLCAIELLEGLGDRRAATVLIPMLDSENDVVREWAARALGELGIKEAVPRLREAYEAVQRRGKPLDWTEPGALRTALTQLGARREVVPARVDALGQSERSLGRCWPVEHLIEVIDSLADADQLVLWFQYWERVEGTHRRRDTPGWDLEWSLGWGDLVESTRTKAVDAARRAGTPSNTVATLSWMNEADHHRSDVR
jgi:HEAT repeats